MIGAELHQGSVAKKEAISIDLILDPLHEASHILQFRTLVLVVRALYWSCFEASLIQQVSLVFSTTSLEINPLLASGAPQCFFFFLQLGEFHV